jgi:threonine-phosphate decarboxylase
LLHYPDPDCVALRETLARRWRLTPDRILIGNGSSELIHLLPRALGIRHALLVGPTFSEYERAVVLAGGSVGYLHAKRSEQYRPPLEQVIHRIEEGRTRADALFLCNPNSPTGQAVDVPVVKRLLVAAAQRRVRVVMDETFADYCEERSVLREMSRFGNLLVLRSFTKFFALPSVRLGCLVASPSLIQQVRALQPPWSVNMPAQTMAVAALADRRHAGTSLDFMRRERAILTGQLALLPGVIVYPSEANFLLLELPASIPAARCAGILASQGLLIRDCSSTPGLNRLTIRVAVRKPAQNRRLVAALRSAIGGRS